MERSDQLRIIEALVLGSPEPISASRLAEIVPQCTPGDAKDLINELNTGYQENDRAFEIWEVAGGYQVRTRAEFSGYLQQLHKQRPLRLSRAALDTLSIIAYKQPVTRGEIEEVRGVEAGPVVKGLLDRRLVRIAGQREVPGRPMLYATTRRFLEVFGLESLKGLPSLRELKDFADQQGVIVTNDQGASETDAAATPAEAGSAEDSESAEGAESVEEAALHVDSAGESEAGEPGVVESDVESEAEVEPVIAESSEPESIVVQAAGSDSSDAEDSADDESQRES
jgi:segregation and condensation protein B